MHNAQIAAVRKMACVENDVLLSTRNLKMRVHHLVGAHGAGKTRVIVELIRYQSQHISRTATRQQTVVIARKFVHPIWFREISASGLSFSVGDDLASHVVIVDPGDVASFQRATQLVRWRRVVLDDLTWPILVSDIVWTLSTEIDRTEHVVSIAWTPSMFDYSTVHVSRAYRNICAALSHDEHVESIVLHTCSATGNVPENTCCVVCLDDIDASLVVALIHSTCRSVFCAGCLLPWVASSQMCPTCREMPMENVYVHPNSRSIYVPCLRYPVFKEELMRVIAVYNMVLVVTENGQTMCDVMDATSSAVRLQECECDDDIILRSCFADQRTVLVAGHDVDSSTGARLQLSEVVSLVVVVAVMHSKVDITMLVDVACGLLNHIGNAKLVPVYAIEME